MRTIIPVVLLLAMVGGGASAPAASMPKRSLLDLGTLINSIIDLGGDQNNYGPQRGGEADSSTDSDGSGSLIDLSPTISLGLSLGSNNGCLGLGISVCDPIKVDQADQQKGLERPTGENTIKTETENHGAGPPVK